MLLQARNRKPPRLALESEPRRTRTGIGTPSRSRLRNSLDPNPPWMLLASTQASVCIHSFEIFFAHPIVTGMASTVHQSFLAPIGQAGSSTTSDCFGLSEHSSSEPLSGCAQLSLTVPPLRTGPYAGSVAISSPEIGKLNEVKHDCFPSESNRTCHFAVSPPVIFRMTVIDLPFSSRPPVTLSTALDIFTQRSGSRRSTVWV